MKFSVIVPTFNGGRTLGEQLQALSRQESSAPWEVLIADNGSTDDTIAVAERFRSRIPHLRILDASDRPGGAHARNVGAREARGAALAFCDQDDVVGERWLSAMMTALEQYEFVAGRHDYSRLNPSWVVFRGVQRALSTIWYPPYLTYAGCTTLGVRRDVHDRFGGFDESFRYLDDTEFCLRLQLAGVKLHFVEDAIVHYRCRVTVKETYRQSRNWNAENVVLSQKYRPSTERNRWRWRPYLRDWVHLMKRLPEARTRSGRMRLAWTLGAQVGRLKSCLRYWVPPDSNY